MSAAIIGNKFTPVNRISDSKLSRKNPLTYRIFGIIITKEKGFFPNKIYSIIKGRRRTL